MIPSKAPRSGARLPTLEQQSSTLSGLPSVGVLLRDERLARGLTLDQVAAATRVPRSHLDAIERGDAAALPSGPFLKGFITSYARYLGKDPDLLGQMLERTSEPAPAPPREGEEPEDAAAPAVPRRRRLLMIAAAAGVGVVGALTWQLTRPAPEEAELAVGGGSLASDKIAPTEGPRSEESRILRGTTLTSSSGERYTVFIDLERGEKPHQIHLKAVHRSYVRVAEGMDSPPVFEAVLEAGEEKDFSSAQELWLVLGNAGGVQVSYNGAQLIDLGLDGDRGAFAFRAE